MSPRTGWQLGSPRLVASPKPKRTRPRCDLAATTYWRQMQPSTRFAWHKRVCDSHQACEANKDEAAAERDGVRYAWLKRCQKAKDAVGSNWDANNCGDPFHGLLKHSNGVLPMVCTVVAAGCYSIRPSWVIRLPKCGACGALS